MDKAIILLFFPSFPCSRYKKHFPQPTKTNQYKMRWGELTGKIRLPPFWLDRAGAQKAVLRAPQGGAVILCLGWTRSRTSLFLLVRNSSFSLGTYVAHVDGNHVNTGRKSCIRLLGGFPTELKAGAYGSKMQHDPGKESPGVWWKAIQFSGKRPWNKSQEMWVLIPALPLASCVTLGKLLYLCISIPGLKMRNLE